MVTSAATTVEQYLGELPDDRHDSIAAIRAVILDNLPDGFVETMNWGMISYEVPFETFADTYNNQPLMYAALASQKNHMAVYLSAVYSDADIKARFVDEYKATGKKLDMGKSCVRFRKLEQLPLDLIGRTIARVSVDDFVAAYRAARG